MPSYVSTPLFSIKEAAASAQSLPASSFSIHQDLVPDKQKTFWKSLNAFKRSEYQYHNELNVLWGIICKFDPVYNNYFDLSLEDVTDEMVELRKTKNNELKKIVKKLATHHSNLGKILELDDINIIFYNISKWMTSTDQLYSEYMDYYKLDINQPKTEIRIRRRPLIRIRYLSNFVKTLKDVVMFFEVREFTSDLLSNLEVSFFKLAKCLERARLLDESEKSRLDTEILTSSCKDIFTLQSICVNLSLKDIAPNSYKCQLFYLHKAQKVSLNFDNIEVFSMERLGVPHIIIVQNDNATKNLMFSPIRLNEFQYIKQVDVNSYQFDHSSRDVQLYFTVQGDTLLNILFKIFPKIEADNKFLDSSFGLGIKTSVTSGDNEMEVDDDAPTAPLYKLKFAGPSTSSLATNLENVLQKNRNSVSQNIRNYSETTEDASEKLAKNFMQDIIENDSSDDESMPDYNIEDISFASLDRHPTNDSESLKKKLNFIGSEIILSHKPQQSTQTQIPTHINTDIHPPVQKVINFEKYQHSFESSASLSSVTRSQSSTSVSSDGSRKKSKGGFLGMISSMLKKDTSSTHNKHLKNLPEESKSISASSNHLTRKFSYSSLSSQLLDILNDSQKCLSVELSTFKMSVWNSNKWESMKLVNAKLFRVHNGFDYISFNEIQKSDTSEEIRYNEKPMLLLKLDSNTSTHTSAMDLQVRSLTSNNVSVLISLRATNKNDQMLIKRVIEDPGFLIQTNFVKQNSNIPLSTSGQFSIQGNMSADRGLFKGALSNSSSWRSILSSATSQTNSTEVSEDECSSNSWMGMCDVTVSKPKELSITKRCVISVAGIKNITVEFTTFESEKESIEITRSQVFEISRGKIIIQTKNVRYLVSFDSWELADQFLGCF
ncbi:hypothetical protein DAMA08_025850 [Martiniozyma asiatica (nom. inval.)]|nr:hypothetical protein DAMA08_025850 [Martiniozyma asiatica]